LLRLPEVEILETRKLSENELIDYANHLDALQQPWKPASVSVGYIMNCCRASFGSTAFLSGFALIALMLFLGPVTFGADVGTAVEELEGGFSYSVPKGWTSTERKGEKFKIALGEAKDGFVPNLSITTKQYAGTLGDYVKASVRGAKKGSPSWKLIGASAILTEVGEPSIRIVSEIEVKETKIRSVTYFFAGQGDSKAFMTFTMLANDCEKHDVDCLLSASTFQFTRNKP